MHQDPLPRVTDVDREGIAATSFKSRLISNLFMGTFMMLGDDFKKLVRLDVENPYLKVLCNDAYQSAIF